MFTPAFTASSWAYSFIKVKAKSQVQYNKKLSPDTFSQKPNHIVKILYRLIVCASVPTILKEKGIA